MAKAAKVVDSISSVKDLLDKLAMIPSHPAPLEVPSLYLDAEGTNLGRNGSIDILTLYFLPDTSTYLINIYTLGSAAFSTKNSQGYSLKSILESPGMAKVFVDVRNDSDALFSLCGISLAGVLDLQLMELAANAQRRSTSPYLCGSVTCIERDLQATVEQKKEWLDAKEKASRAFHPDMFKQRPMTQQIMAYCAQDVPYLPNLWTIYASEL